MLEPSLVTRGGLASKASVGRQHPNSRIDDLCSNSTFRTSRFTAETGWPCIESHRPRLGWRWAAFTQGNL